MPKTTAYLDYSFVFWENYIRRARQNFAMQSESEAVFMKERTYNTLRSRIF